MIVISDAIDVIDLPLIFHPVGIRVSVGNTPEDVDVATLDPADLVGIA